MKTYSLYLYTFYIGYTVCMACNKTDRLNDKPVSTLNTPGTLPDLQRLLDNNEVMNEVPGLGDRSADNYFLPPSTWKTLSFQDQNTYLWAKDLFLGEGAVIDWDAPYKQVLYSNVILKSLKSIDSTIQSTTWRSIKGSALFFRAHAFYNVAQLFALPYNISTSTVDPGIPLRLNDNLLEPSTRSTVQKTYEQILADLSEATTLLPAVVDAAHINRPSKPAALGLLARVYLNMRMYDLAGAFADSCLKAYNKLMDYNTLSPAQFLPRNNPEILFYAQTSYNPLLFARVSKSTLIDSALYHSYDTNDLRASLFFGFNSDGQPYIRNSYTGNLFPFAGIATDEMILTRAECHAHAGDTGAALKDLNDLLQKRWKQGTFVRVTVTSNVELLQSILNERRKELPFRNTRWADLRRLNKEGMNIYLTRLVNAKLYVLPPNDPKYTLPIPPDVMALSGMEQNNR